MSRLRRTPPADPEVRALIRAAQASAVSRRRLLGGVGLGVGAALGSSALTGCAPPTPPAGGATALKLPDDISASDQIINWANWTAYLDYDEKLKAYPTLEGFSKKTGIAASYFEDIEDNDSYISKIRPQLQAGQDINRDLFTLTDWMAARVIRDQLCQPLQMIYMPNVAANMLPALKDVPFDPGRQQSVTWQSGFVGIGYDRRRVGKELKTLDDLWNTPSLKGRITVLSEWRDTVALVMQSQGVDITADWGKTQFENAVAVIDEKIADGTIRRVKGNSYMEDLKSGNALAGIVWSGDLFILRYETENPDWELAIPESGCTLWSDNFMVPITSRHRSNAQALINYYYQPEVAAQVAAWVNYVCPVVGAQAEMEKIDPELAQSPFIFPTQDYITKHNIQSIRALAPEEDLEFSEIWARTVGN